MNTRINRIGSVTEPLSLPRLVATTREIDPVEALAYADPSSPTVWTRNGDGLVAAGPDLLHIDVAEDGRITALADLWRAISQTTDIDDEVGVPGTGLVGFGAFAFDESSARPSTLIVPTAVLGHRGGRMWLTRIRVADQPDEVPVPEPVALGPSWSATLGPGAMDPEAHAAAVRAALDVIGEGEVSKIVIARDLIGSVPAHADLRLLVRSLADDYPNTWTYAVDGMIGASPETLVTVTGGSVSARVLAGTRPRGADIREDELVSSELQASGKDRAEHRFAVDSVLDALRPHTSELRQGETFPLELPNLWHLATDVRGTLDNGASALDMVRAIHPTAAVAGTPTDRAMAEIRRIEGFDRGRYAGPVGWIDANGDGEWAIALRGAQFAPEDPSSDAPRTVSAHAGGGIVPGSVAEAELTETRVKFRPIIDALA